jgi:esterase
LKRYFQRSSISAILALGGGMLLAFDRISDGAGTDSTVDIVVLHGILGSGRNWRSVARQLSLGRPDLGVATVDLRNHGRSQRLPGRDDIAACCDDLDALVAAGAMRPSIVIGHSFGGKVAMEWTRRRPSALTQMWVLDALPGGSAAVADDSGIVGAVNDVRAVLAMVAAVDVPAASRAAITAQLRSLGASASMADWLGTSVEQRDNGATWVFEAERIAAMLDDYAQLDSWDVLERPPQGVDVHFVRAGLSPRWSSTEIARLAAFGPTSASVWTLPAAGHWLHVDDPAGLLALVLAHLPKSLPDDAVQCA